jgi:2,4'-dihydroxyacetophenone dioxygenase
MNYENVRTSCIDVERLPWIPFTPYSAEVELKYVKLDPVRGEVIALLKSPAGIQMPRHHHSGTVIVHTLAGRWKYVEHDWVAGPGSVVFETAGSEHTPQALPDGGEVVALNIVVGDLVYLDADDRVIAIENWKTALQRYLGFCREHGIEPEDLTAFDG